MGACFFYQATGVYLEPGRMDVDNEIVTPGRGTDMEHHWDEAFGYFGAARDFSSYSLEQIASKRGKDTNGDGYISLLAEQNLGVAPNAAKRDLGAVNNPGLTKNVYDLFWRGRALVARGATLESVKPFAKQASIYWEKVIAATVVHYINKTISEMDSFGSADYLFKDHVKYWAEMKGYALAFQFSPYSPMHKRVFLALHEKMGNQPVLMDRSKSERDSYKASLLKARDLLESTYGFNRDNVSNW